MDNHSFEKLFSDDIQKVKKLHKTGPSDEWLSRTRGELLQHMIDHPPRQSSHYGFKFRFATLATVLLTVTGITSGVGFAAQNSLPDDQLYPIKRATEQIQVLFTPQADEKAKLKIKLAQRRQDEVQTLIHLKPERVAENPDSVVAVLNESKLVIEEELARLRSEVTDLKAQRDAIASEVASSLAIEQESDISKSVLDEIVLTVEEIIPEEHIGGGVIFATSTAKLVKKPSVNEEKATKKVALIETTVDKSIPQEVKDALVSSELVKDEVKELLEEVEELKNTEPVDEEVASDDVPADGDESEVDDTPAEEIPGEETENATSTDEVIEEVVEEASDSSEI